MTNDHDALLIHYLTEQGLDWPEIERVLARVREFDKRTVRESVFDSIEQGSFRLDEIIAQARHGSQPAPAPLPNAAKQ